MLESCKKCPKVDNCSFQEDFDTVAEVDLVIVTDFQEKPKSEYSKVVKMLIEGAGIPEDRVLVTGAVKFRTDKDAKVKEITACREILQKEINKSGAKALVLMGNNALKSVLDQTGISSVRGHVLEWGDLYVVPTYNVGMILHNPDNIGIMTDDFKRAWDTAIQGHQEVEHGTYTTIKTIDEWKELYYNLKAQDMFAFDIETNDPYDTKRGDGGPNPYRDGAKILAMSFCFEQGVAYCLPLWAKQSPFDDDVLDEIILNDLLDLMADEKVKKVAHNGKFDCQYLMINKGIEVKNYWFDTMLAHYMTNEEKGTHSLKRLAWQHTPMGGYDALLDGELKKLSGPDKNLDNVDLDIMTYYCAADSDVCFRLIPIMLEGLKAEDQYDFFFEHVMRMHEALMQIEMNGFSIDETFLSDMEEGLPKQMEAIYEKMRCFPESLEIERRLNHKANEGRKTPAKPEKINFNSVYQVRDLLFDVMALTPVKHTEKNKDWTPSEGIEKASTDADTLEELKNEHELIPLLLQYRKLAKFYGTYVKPVRMWQGPDGLVHSNYLIHGTVTGRLSSQKPNAQNIPRSATSGLIGVNYKNLFIPRTEGRVLIQADYSQMEMRVLAMFCLDPLLMKAFRDDIDLHKYAAFIVDNIPLAEVTKDQRQIYKTIQFGLVYCKGARSLAEELHWYRKNGDPDTKKAQAAIDRYFSRYTRVKPWITKTQEFAKKNGYVKSLFGRKRRLPEVRSLEEWAVSDALRQAVNAPIQATASDITMWSLYTLMDEMKRLKMASKVIITVHDSIVIDAVEEEVESVVNLLLTICNNPPFDWINVPIKIDIGIGYKWGELTDIE
jgi:uracil-DNA glycosylase family 4